MKITIKQAGLTELEDFLPLFDAYRVFHNLESNLEEARVFLTERLRSNEATVFVAYDSEASNAVGFALLYQTYSNHSLRRVMILNDLFTLSGCRGQGIGQLLMAEVTRYAKERDAGKLRLVTTKDNLNAKRFYEHLSFVHEQGFDMYELAL